MAEKFVPAVRKMKNPVCTGFLYAENPRPGRENLLASKKHAFGMQSS
jgi:hypothetical protein